MHRITGYRGQVDMLHLRYFVAVAEEGNFSRAATRLHMAASPLSQRIKHLESDLGSALFIRAHHRIDLTPAGETLLPVARELLEKFDSIPTLLREQTASACRELVIGVASDVTSELRSAVAAEIRSHHPDARPTFRPGATDPLLQLLHDGELDAALLHGDVSGRGISTVRLHTAEIHVAVGSGTGFDGRTQVRLDELAHLAFASIEHDAAPTIYRGIDDLLRRHGIHKRIIVPGYNFGGLAHVVADGQAFSLVGSPTGAMAKAFFGEPIHTLEVIGTRLRLSTVAAWPTARDAAGIDLEGIFRALAARRSHPPQNGLSPRQPSDISTSSAPIGPAN